MKNWQKTEIIDDNGEKQAGIAPVIISASRSTDIPTYYSDWFFNRLEKGYLVWINPFNRKEQYVSFKNCRLIVFWTKDPNPIIPKLKILDNNKINYYFQFTLNDYESENLEPNLVKLENRIQTFKELSNKIGKQKVIWRFDPLILSERISIEILLKRIEKIGIELKNYTDKLVISFADILTYKKVRNNLKNTDETYREFSEDEINKFSKGLSVINQKLNLQIATCAEDFNLQQFGINKNKCIDDELIVKEFSNDYKLMEFIGHNPQGTLFDNIQYNSNEKLKDKGQRIECGCIMSKDIGMYNTCNHQCVYCYANSSIELVKQNMKLHSKNYHSLIKK